VGRGGNYAPDLVFEGWRPVVSETRNAWLGSPQIHPNLIVSPQHFVQIASLLVGGTAAAPGLIVKTGYLGLLWFFSVAENIFFRGPDDQVDLDDYF
jgi:hypothetical protein